MTYTSCADFYDLIHGGKKYSSDIDFLKNALQDYHVSTSREILEVGCGTGNHTLLLAQIFERVVASDIDPEMLERTKKKLAAHNILNVELCDLYQEDSPFKAHVFDLGCSFFNVINYIKDPEALESFFLMLAAHLRKDGLFIFDCFGDDKFQESIYEDVSYYQKVGSSEKVRREICSEYDAKRQILSLKEAYFVEGKQHQVEGFCEYKLWKRSHLFSVLSSCGFEVLSCSSKDRPAFDKKTGQDIYIIKRS